MEHTDKQERQKKNWIFISVIAVLFFVVILVANNDALRSWFKGFMSLLRPILIGLVLAYLCNPIFRLFERVLLYKLRPPALRRATSLILTYLCLLLVLALIVLLILPQLVTSISDFAANYKSYMQSATNQINNAIASLNELAYNLSENEALLTYLEPGELEETIAGLFGAQNTNQLLETLYKLDMQQLVNLIGNAMSIVADSIFGVFISIYLLSTKEKRYAQVMKIRHAFFNDSINQRITRFCTIADRSFGGYLEGKLLDSLIVGILTFILLSIFRIPYALLIATFIGIANIVPIVGPIIGAVPTALILLISAPTKLLPFLVIVILVQQIDGNIISPKILGSNTGVSPLCVMIAVSTVGAVWGLLGMVLAVPLFATVLEMADDTFTERLQKKGLPSGVENYYAADAPVDPSTNANVTTDRIVRRFERYVVRLRDRCDGNEKLLRRHRLTLALYKRLINKGVIKQVTDEEQARFSANAAAAQAQELVDATIDRMRWECEIETAAHETDETAPEPPCESGTETVTESATEAENVQTTAQPTTDE